MRERERERSVGRLKEPGCEMTGGEYTYRVCWIASFKAHNASLSQFRRDIGTFTVVNLKTACDMKMFFKRGRW